jgi:hypothetical protein
VLDISVTAENWRDVLAWPHLDRVYSLKLEGRLPRGWAAAVAGCPGLRNVSDLNLRKVPVRPTDLRAILDAWAGRWLTQLGLHDSPIGDPVLKVLARHPTTAGIQNLELWDVGLTPSGARLLATGGGLTRLRRVTIHDPIGDAGLTELLRSPHLQSLRMLFLVGTGVTDAGAAVLADCPGLTGLRALYLTSNQIGVAGARALCRSPHLGKLRTLYLADNPIAESAEGKALKEQFGHVSLGI